MKEVGFLLTMTRGAIGKEIVVKHYRYGVVVTRYPDMSGVRASAGQRACRDVFREAVAFAKGVFADGVRKEHYREKLGKVRGLFQAVVKVFMQEAKRGKEGEKKKGRGERAGRRHSAVRRGRGGGLHAVGYRLHTGSGAANGRQGVCSGNKAGCVGRAICGRICPGFCLKVKPLNAFLIRQYSSPTALLMANGRLLWCKYPGAKYVRRKIPEHHITS